MDLIPYGTKNELTLVAVLTMVPGQLLAIPGNLVAGYLSKRGGPLYLLRRLVPLASVLVTLGAFMAQVQEFWFIAVTAGTITKRYEKYVKVSIYRESIRIYKI